MTDMKSLLVLLCFLFSAFFASMSHARRSPLLSPLFSPQPQPAPPITVVASPPLVMNVIVEDNHHHMHKELLLAIILASIGVIMTIVSIFCVIVFYRRNRRNSGSKTTQSSDAGGRFPLGPIFSKFNTVKTTPRKGSMAMVDFALLEAVTNNFSDSNVLGQGGFGCVYKAQFEEGVLAAVKKLDGGGYECVREFENELNLLERIRHANIISLAGYCIHEETRFLVYELMQNGSLETLLHGPTRGSTLTWHIRMKIALDTARGLEYLHEHCDPPIIHRDLKSSNILLDSDFNAKIADFGLAVTSGNLSKGHVKISGTLGYVAPEYLLDGKLSEKSDVYAFGVVLLELLMGRRPVEKLGPSQCQTLVTWAMPQLTDRSKLPNLIDPAIRNTMDLKHLYQVAAVAVLCIQPEPSYRPLITDILHSLIPLVPIELGGTHRVIDPLPQA
ncbi:probable receptor-like protein kinase At1g80640 [Dioscorea cayenensis subsp. rotundata]|uniref:Probable receptor-like protein kinase At1g80640 n=1 Tax=Dioscorea cayennensis subsp. rotundata TaxID=55577 RepID=A0AB40BZJ8_DIOCR|nr:probable receptor-like protein kinase At1g80640 [Dioscorea cayenensis subsp. rotundata]